jgi:hypothetical protein
MKKDLAIAVCHFNWAKCVHMARNFNRFIRYLESKEIPYYGVELSMDDIYESTGLDTFKRIQVSIDNVLFQKEACINMVVRDIPEEYTKIAWIDHDVFFQNDGWYESASQSLEQYKIVQLFSRCFDTNQYGRISEFHKSFMKNIFNNYLQIKNPNFNFGLFGMAWAARRDLWNYGGLYPYCFLGGGDGLFDMTLFDLDREDRLQPIEYTRIHKHRNEYISWKDTIVKFASKQESNYLDDRIYHEWHGERETRKYRTRYELAKNLTLDNFFINDQGLLQTRNVDKSQHDAFLGYFLERS